MNLTKTNNNGQATIYHCLGHEPKEKTIGHRLLSSIDGELLYFEELKNYSITAEIPHAVILLASESSHSNPHFEPLNEQQQISKMLDICLQLDQIIAQSIEFIAIAESMNFENQLKANQLSRLILIQPSLGYSKCALILAQCCLPLAARKTALGCKQPCVLADTLNDCKKAHAHMIEAIDAHALVSRTDSHGIINYVNQKFCDISQYNASDLIGHSHKMVNSGYHKASFFADMWLTMSSGKIWRGLICNRKKDGSRYWVNSTIYPIPVNTPLPFKKIIKLIQKNMPTFPYGLKLPI